MKLLSIAIPCYNSQDYMEKCIQSLLVGGDDVEIIIVDDGSKDATPEIADKYQKRFPNIVRAIHKENGGHGSAVNAGIANATGMFFKVVDSDDWVDESVFLQVLDRLRELALGDDIIDLFIANFVYDKDGAKHKKVMKYTSMFPVEKVFGWSDVKLITKGHYLLMHSVIYRTQVLRKCELQLPEHTFYVDNIYVYHPLPYVKKMYYMDVDLYHYYIGRDDQSVNESVMIGRIDQQLKVNRIMIEDYDLWKISNKKLRRYMFNYLEIITVVSTVLLLRSGTEENLEKKRTLWKYIKNYDLRLFHRLRNGIMGNAMNLPGKGGRKISVAAYRLTQKIVGFN
ncbi:MAG: glycosyltransferase family 2 protein [Lachnospiraceae bacterium]|nr:glycosyltransferase [Lachnospiraceae bacterium]MDY3817873.1 glycosyltransferase family 2 protein [Lachnospiraceae bacterium]